MEDIDPAVLSVLMKGEPGTRKSTCALSFPKPQFWVSYDFKMESLGIPMRQWKINPKDIEFQNFKDWNSGKKKLEDLQVNPVTADRRRIATLVVDSVTSMGDSVNQQTLQLKQGTSRKSGADAGRIVGGIAVNEVEDYNAEAAAFQELIAILKDIRQTYKINTILIAHILQTETRSLDGKTHMSRTLVTGGKKVAAKIPAYFGEIYHFNIETSLDASKGGQYSCLTTHTGDDFARTSLPLEPKIIFGNEPLYDKYLLPAIKRMKGEGPSLIAV